LGYITKGTIFDEITSVQYSLEEINDVAAVGSQLSLISNGTMNLGSKALNPTISGADADVDFQNTKSSYKSYIGVDYEQNAPQNKLAVGELFTMFFAGIADSTFSMDSFSVKATQQFYSQAQKNLDAKDIAKRSLAMSDVNNITKLHGNNFFERLQSDLSSFLYAPNLK
ncbi:MAG: hypothetical protein RL154_1431, partial [Pseudomonadota bacterium]